MHILVLLCSIWEINSLFSFFLQSYLLKRENSKALYWLKGFFKKLSYTEILNLVNACFKISRVAALTQQHKAVSMFLRTSGWSSVLRKAGLFFFFTFLPHECLWFFSFVNFSVHHQRAPPSYFVWSSWALKTFSHILALKSTVSQIHFFFFLFFSFHKRNKATHKVARQPTGTKHVYLGHMKVEARLITNFQSWTRPWQPSKQSRTLYRDNNKNMDSLYLSSLRRGFRKVPSLSVVTRCFSEVFGDLTLHLCELSIAVWVRERILLWN